VSPLGYVEVVAMTEKDAREFGLVAEDKITRVEDRGEPPRTERYREGARLFRLYYRDLRAV
jgi:hypothetical protein